MNSKDYIKEKHLYKIGYCVKLNRTFSKEFPPNEIYTIINLTTNNNDDLCFVLDRKIPNRTDNIFHYSYVFRDDDCKKMERKLKLNEISDNLNEKRG